MALNTLIQWAKHTLNFWWGCTKVSEACWICYAEAMDARRGPLMDNGRTHWGPNAPRWLRVERAVAEAEKINRAAARDGDRPRVFVNSMSASFEDHPDLPGAREKMLLTLDRLTDTNWLLLTKRPENVRRMVPAAWLETWPKHVWIGTTVENQARADERIPHLLAVPAAVRFLSVEPMLGPVVLDIHGMPGYWQNPLTGEVSTPRSRHHSGERIQWVICGGESGSQARPWLIEWAWDLQRQCAAASVPFFMKQLGCNVGTTNANALDWPDHVRFQVVPGTPQAAGARVFLNDWKGGNFEEFPTELRVREVPS